MKKKAMAILLMVCVLAHVLVAPVSAEAAEATGVAASGYLVLSVSKDNQMIDGVTAWKDAEGDVYVNDFATLRKIFPSETAGLTAEMVPAPVYLYSYAKAFGYELGITPENVLLVTKKHAISPEITTVTNVSVEETTTTTIIIDNSVTNIDNSVTNITINNPVTTVTPVESSSPETTTTPTEAPVTTVAPTETTTPVTTPATTVSPTTEPSVTITPTTEPTPSVPEKVENLKVYINGGDVNVTVAKWTKGKDIYVDSFTDLYKIFWRETANMTLPAKKGKVNLTRYSKMFGCKVEVNPWAAKIYVSYESVDKKNIEVWYNGKKFVVSGPRPYMKNGMVVVPVSVFKLMKVGVKTYSKEKLVVLSKGKKYVRASIGSKKYFANGKEGSTATKTVYKKFKGKNVVMVPIAHAKSLGYTVTWNSRTNRVQIIEL